MEEFILNNKSEGNTRITITLSKKLRKVLEIIAMEEDKTISEYISEITLPKAEKKLEEIKKEKLKIWALSLSRDDRMKKILTEAFTNPENYPENHNNPEVFKNSSEEKKEELLTEYIIKNLSESLINLYDVHGIFEI